MKIIYRHYRIPADYWKREGDPPKKGKPPLKVARYMRGVTKWTPHERGGMTTCRILNDAGEEITRGQIVCFMEDHFCYREGRERSLQNAYEKIALQTGNQMMNHYIAGLKSCDFDRPLHWATSRSTVCPECEKSRKELEKSFELAFAGWESRTRKTPKETTVIEAHANNKDAYMRKSLFKMIWDDAEKELHPNPNAPPRPFPSMTDDQVREELKRILGI